jgi:predicted PurR-regulated permease PerM
MTTRAASDRNEFVRNAIEAAIKIGVVLIIVLWCFQIVRPFIGIVVWGIIIAVAIFPMARKIAGLMGGRRKSAAALVTLLMLLVLAAPAVELTAIVVDNVNSLSGKMDEGVLQIPLPPEGVASWPLIGEPVAEFWALAATNLTDALKIIEPQLKAVGAWLLGTLAGMGLGLLQFIAAIIIAGVFMAQAEASGRFARALGRRLAGDRGEELTALAESTVRGVARGVIGVAFIQSALAGIGLVVADIPGAGIWALLCLLLAIIQLGVAPVMIGAIIYMFATANTMPAVIFTVYAIVVSGIDNVLKPLLMGRGLDVPMPVILVGTIGGMLLSGVVGLFIGAVILALGYKLFTAWVFETPESGAESGDVVE